jgi:DNA-binding SARP family transcriptional activator
LDEITPETPLATFRIRLFGKLSVHRDGEDISDHLSPKSQELLAYLLVFRERWHARERLAGAIWPDAPALEARSRVRRLLWRLQQGLDARSDPPAGLLRIHSDWVGINPEADLWLDLAAIERTGDMLNGMSNGTLTCAQVVDLQSAADLFQGELLGNWYRDWCVTERERLTFFQLSLLGRLTDHFIATEQIDRGLAATSDMLRIDRAHESAHRKAMQLYSMAGDRTRALRQFQACKTALQDELGVEPERATIDLYRLLRDEDVRPFTGGTPIEPLPVEATSIEEISARIDRLQTLANVSHDQIWQELHQLRNSLDHRTL